MRQRLGRGREIGLMKYIQNGKKENYLRLGE